MPDKYKEEIEEILRDLGESCPARRKPTVGETAGRRAGSVTSRTTGRAGFPGPEILAVGIAGKIGRRGLNPAGGWSVLVQAGHLDWAGVSGRRVHIVFRQTKAHPHGETMAGPADGG